MTESDLEHLTDDANRVCQLLVKEWVGYIGHLKKMYPYLFSPAVRKNTFKMIPSVEVK